MSVSRTAMGLLNVGRQSFVAVIRRPKSANFHCAHLVVPIIPYGRDNIHGVTHATRKNFRRKSGETELSGLWIFLGPTTDHAAWRRLALAGVPLPDSKLGTTMARLCVGSAGKRAIRMGSEHISFAELRRRQRGIREPIECARGAGGTLHRGCNRADGRRAMPRQGEDPNHRGCASEFG